MRNRYFLMRHGESLANVADTIVSLPANGLEGFGLSALGLEQARASAQASGLGPSTIVVTSDFLRTRQTAEVARQTLGAPPARLHQGLRERAFGTLEGQSGDRYQQVWSQDDRDPEHTLFGVESAEALAKRLRQVLSELEDAHRAQEILLVSHGDPLRFLQLAAAGRSLTEHSRIQLFAPAEIRLLTDLRPAQKP
jgi:probable phosphoglycerate mutase